jgi:hypothetical protein
MPGLRSQGLRAHTRLHSCRPTCCPQGLPRGAAELGQLQDHYHQNDNDQDPDDGSDNSSVHFASLDTRADSQLSDPAVEHDLSLASGSELREASAIRWPDPAPSTTKPPQGRMHYTPREVEVALWKVR